MQWITTLRIPRGEPTLEYDRSVLQCIAQKVYVQMRFTTKVTHSIVEKTAVEVLWPFCDTGCKFYDHACYEAFKADGAEVEGTADVLHHLPPTNLACMHIGNSHPKPQISLTDSANHGLN
eukprot:6469738-Amphidinium_carterae.1